MSQTCRRLSYLAILMCLLLNVSLVWGGELSFQHQQTREQIQTVLDSEPFNKKEIKTGWRAKNLNKEDDDSIPQWLIDFAEWLESRERSEASKNNWSDSIRTIALVIEVIFWLVFIGLILYLIYHFREAVGRGVRVFYKPQKVHMPATIAGLDVSKESLPDDVVQTARLLWSKQQYRQAVGLLYRASLSHLLHDYECQLLSSFTEQECLDAASRLPQPTLVEWMQGITHSWQQLAYAHQVPAKDRFEQHCSQWEQVFTQDDKEQEQ